MSSSTQQSSAQNRPAFTTQALVTMAIFAAILCISAYISIPLPLPGSPHITLLNFVILLIALLFPLQQSFLIVLVWMLLGCVSLPVFIGGGAGIGDPDMSLGRLHLLLPDRGTAAAGDPRFPL